MFAQVQDRNRTEDELINEFNVKMDTRSTMETTPQAKASFCWYCKRTFSVDVTYRQHLGMYLKLWNCEHKATENVTILTAEYHKMAPETIEEVTSSGDVNRGSPSPAATSQEDSVEGTAGVTRTRRSSEPPETHDSDIGKHP